MSRSRSIPLSSFLLFSAMACAATAQDDGVGVKVSFRPSIAIVVGIFTMIFSLTFLLLMYAKFCHQSSTPLLPTQTAAPPPPAAAAALQPTNTVSKSVIDSLPFFRFAALRGARQGLECAVCLSRFDDADLLRLLPRCHHAFHLHCVDRWLETSASCPLCRTHVEAQDADLGIKYAASARFVFGGDDASSSGRDLLAGIFVERVASSRFSAVDHNRMDLDRHNHRIIVSDAVFKSRWSDLNSADLIALDSEMLRSMSSGRFPTIPSPDDDYDLFRKVEEEEGISMAGNTEKKRLLATSVVNVSDSEPEAARMVSSGSGVRSMSEIVRLPRVRAEARTEEEERARRRWMPIARRTARWLARREEAVETADASFLRSPPV